jgi:hypothetical protein
VRTGEEEEGGEKEAEFAFFELVPDRLTFGFNCPCCFERKKAKKERRTEKNHPLQRAKRNGQNGIYNVPFGHAFHSLTRSAVIRSFFLSFLLLLLSRFVLASRRTCTNSDI